LRIDNGQFEERNIFFQCGDQTPVQRSPSEGDSLF